MAELPALKLERARFMVNITTPMPTRRRRRASIRVEFHVQTNPGTRPGPIMKVASGGELSRFLLALKVALADRGSAPTLVFDEIDTGVGGAVADAIGQRLKRLSSTRAGSFRYPCAAGGGACRDASPDLQGAGRRRRGDRHRVATMDDGARTEEIARMLRRRVGDGRGKGGGGAVAGGWRLARGKPPVAILATARRRYGPPFILDVTHRGACGRSNGGWSRTLAKCDRRYCRSLPSDSASRTALPRRPVRRGVEWLSPARSFGPLWKTGHDFAVDL